MSDLQGFATIAASSAAVYLFIIAAIRLFGKKELSQLAVTDLVFILLISNSVQNAMVGSNTSLLGGLVAAATLFCLNFVFKKVLYKSRKISRIVQGEPILLVYRGVLNEQHMHRAMITRRELDEAIREHGIASVREVSLAVLEIDGNISVLAAQESAARRQ